MIDFSKIKFTRDVAFDRRSRNHPVSELTTGKQPRSYTWRCRQVLDQGSEGSCVGHAWAHELIARPAEVRGIDHSFATEKIYWEAQKVDPWTGGAYPGATPFYEGSNVLAGAKAVMMLGLISGYKWAFGLEDLVYGVGHHGPAVLGIPWYESMNYPNMYGDIHIEGNKVGGHAILCNGVNVKQKWFRLHNSWGVTWGIGGECFISFRAMERLLADNGEACFAVGRKRRASI